MFLDEDNRGSKRSVNSSLYKFYTLKTKENVPELYQHVHVDKKGLEIKISATTKASANNLFKSSYILYVVETSIGWKTKKRFSDFVWLHSYLKKKYLGLPIPPVPSKTTMRSFDEKHIEYRMRIF